MKVSAFRNRLIKYLKAEKRRDLGSLNKKTDPEVYEDREDYYKDYISSIEGCGTHEEVVEILKEFEEDEDTVIFVLTGIVSGAI